MLLSEIGYRKYKEKAHAKYIISIAKLTEKFLRKIKFGKSLHVAIGGRKKNVTK